MILIIPHPGATIIHGSMTGATTMIAVTIRDIAIARAMTRAGAARQGHATSTGARASPFQACIPKRFR